MFKADNLLHFFNLKTFPFITLVARL